MRLGQSWSPWLIALGLALTGCKCAETQPVSPHADVIAAMEAWPDCAGVPGNEYWYRIRLQGRDAGYRHLVIRECDTPSAARLLLEIEERFEFLRAGQLVDMRSRTRALLDGRGCTLRLASTRAQSGQPPRVLQAGRVGSEMITVRGPEKRVLPFEPEAKDGDLFHRFVLPEEIPEAGREIRFRSYSASTAGYVDNRIEVLPTEGGIQLVHTTAEMPGMRIRMNLDQDRVLRTADARLGDLQIEYRRSDRRPARDDRTGLADVASLMRVETIGSIEDPRRAELVRCRLENLPPQVDTGSFSGPGQRVVAEPGSGVLVVESFRLGPPPRIEFPPGPPGPDLARWLRPTALAQAHHPEVRALARELTGGAGDSWTAARRLRNWIAAEIQGDMGLNFASAAEVLRARRGDCSEKSVLLTALARSVGIPARSVVGLVYHRGAFAGHMWTEVWVGEWRPLDAALEPETPHPARIRLAVHPLDLSDDRTHVHNLSLIIVSGVRVVIEK